MGNRTGTPHRKPSKPLIDATVQAFKDARGQRGLSIPDLAKASGLADAAIRAFEGGQTANPTLATLEAYASGLGMLIAVAIVSLDKVANLCSPETGCVPSEAATAV